MTEEMLKNEHQEVVDRSNEIFKNFYPSIGSLPAQINLLEMEFAIVTMYIARKACKQYGAAMELMKAIPDAIPPDVGRKWLLKLGRKVIWAYFKKDQELFKAVRDAVENGNRITYQDLIDGREDEVLAFLKKYQHILKS